MSLRWKTPWGDLGAGSHPIGRCTALRCAALLATTDKLLTPSFQSPLNLLALCPHLKAPVIQDSLCTRCYPSSFSLPAPPTDSSVASGCRQRRCVCSFVFFCFFVFSPLTAVSIYSKLLSLHTARRRAAGTCGPRAYPLPMLTCTAGSTDRIPTGAALVGFKKGGGGGIMAIAPEFMWRD